MNYYPSSRKMEINAHDLYYEIFLRTDYDTILRIAASTRSDPDLSGTIRKILTNNNFWHQKLSQEIKTFWDPSVHWAQVYKFFASKKLYPALLEEAALTGLITELKLLLLNGVDPTAGNNRAIRSAAARGHYGVVDQLLRDPQLKMDITKLSIDCSKIQEPRVLNTSVLAV